MYERFSGPADDHSIGPQVERLGVVLRIGEARCSGAPCGCGDTAGTAATTTAGANARAVLTLRCDVGWPVQRLVLQRHVETTEQGQDRDRDTGHGSACVQQDHGYQRDIETDEQTECEPLDPTVPLCPPPPPRRPLSLLGAAFTPLYRPDGLGPAITPVNLTYARLFHDTGRFSHRGTAVRNRRSRLHE